MWCNNNDALNRAYKVDVEMLDHLWGFSCRSFELAETSSCTISDDGRHQRSAILLQFIGFVIWSLRFDCDRQEYLRRTIYLPLTLGQAVLFDPNGSWRKEFGVIIFVLFLQDDNTRYGGMRSFLKFPWRE